MNYFWGCVEEESARIAGFRFLKRRVVEASPWRRLGLHEFFGSHVRQGREQVDWASVACILSLGRFCNQGSDLALSERWYATTALDDLLGVSADMLYDNRLYPGLDELLPLRDELFGHLRERYQSLFGSRFEFLLCDMTSTYFEGQAERNPQAQRGYSQDKRSDCKQVCIELVVTPDGLPLAYEVFSDHRADVTTVEDIVNLMEWKHGLEFPRFSGHLGGGSDPGFSWFQSPQVTDNRASCGASPDSKTLRCTRRWRDGHLRVWRTDADGPVRVSAWPRTIPSSRCRSRFLSGSCSVAVHIARARRDTLHPRTVIAEPIAAPTSSSESA